VDDDNPYVPLNSPALSDLFDALINLPMFSRSRQQAQLQIHLQVTIAHKIYPVL
jgi:hypothetical protein